MSVQIELIRPGLQTTLQGSIRAGYRHSGVPGSGAADVLSMSLANRLVGGRPDQLSIEMTLTGASFRFHAECQIAVTGAPCDVTINENPSAMHETLQIREGDEVSIGPAKAGCRSYLAISGMIEADSFLGSQSTYLPGHFGGFEGRALKAGDILIVNGVQDVEHRITPHQLRPLFNDNVLLQACASTDFAFLTGKAKEILLEDGLTVTQRASRMGVELSGQDKVETTFRGQKLSSPVFPGSVQCPPEGKPFVLLADAQTTGGYPHILQVARSDLFQLGQLRPGAHARFILRTPEEACERYRARAAAYSDWLSPSLI